jgi:hypothetical protein
MQSGSWQIRIAAQGAQGQGTVSVPIPAVARNTRRMPAGLGAFLFALMLALVLGLIAISGAAVREAQLEPGAIPGSQRRFRGRFVMVVVALLLVGTVWFGDRWWNSEAADYSQYIYKPLQMQASLAKGGTLTLNIKDPGWLLSRKTDDFIPDHDHLMHLYLIREPALDVVYHLHPDLTAPVVFELTLPSMPAGSYNLYADVVHEDGFPETMTASLKLPQMTGRPLAGDDAMGAGTAAATNFLLPDGYRMIFKTRDAHFKARRPELFSFELLDPQGNSPRDMALYMGMPGHAAFVKTDGSVFAHIHPNGTVAMAAFMLAQPSVMEMPHASMGMSDMPGMTMAKPNTVSFPYGFPGAGEYRIFVQMKHGETVETGIFQAAVGQ